MYPGTGWAALTTGQAFQPDVPIVRRVRIVRLESLTYSKRMSMGKIFSATWRGIIGCFVAGILAILPLVITVAIVVWVAKLIESVIGPDTFFGAKLRALGLIFTNNTASIAAYSIGWIVVLVGVFILGVMVRIGAQNLWQRTMNFLIRRVPVVGNVYETAEQLVDMLKRKDTAELRGMRVVFCVFGKENASGVLALMPSPERFRINGNDYHAVIIPTAPVPVGGALLFVPVEFVQRSDVSMEGLMSIYMSMGVTAPQYLSPATLSIVRPDDEK